MFAGTICAPYLHPQTPEWGWQDENHHGHGTGTTPFLVAHSKTILMLNIWSSTGYRLSWHWLPFAQGWQNLADLTRCWELSGNCLDSTSTSFFAWPQHNDGTKCTTKPILLLCPLLPFTPLPDDFSSWRQSFFWVRKPVALETLCHTATHSTTSSQEVLSKWSLLTRWASRGGNKWQSCVENKDYFIAYYNTFKVLYCH